MGFNLQLLFTGIGVGSIYALVALGFALIYRATNVVNFAQGDFAMLGAFAMVVLAIDLELPYWLSILITLALLVGFGALFNLAVYYPLRNRGFLPVIISTIGASILLENGVLAAYGPRPQSLDSMFAVPGFSIGDVFFDSQYIVIIVVSMVMVALQYVFFEHTLLGKKLQATSQDKEMASLLGIPVAMMVMITFAYSAALGGLAGMLVAPILFVSVGMGGLDRAQGLRGQHHRRLWLDPRRHRRRAGARRHRDARCRLHLGTLQGRLRVPAGAGFSDWCARRAVRRKDRGEGMSAIALSGKRRARGAASGLPGARRAAALVAVRPCWPRPLSAYYLNIMMQAATYAIAVLGLVVVLGYCGQINLAQAAFFGLGAYGVALGTVDYAPAILPSLLTGVAVATIPGLLLRPGQPAARRTLSGNGDDQLPAILTLVLTNWIGFTHGPDGVPQHSRRDSVGLSFANAAPYLGLCLVARCSYVAWSSGG